MKYIFVGDIHGKVEQVERALAKDGMKIFVGDLIDSWDRSLDDHTACYELVIAAIKTGEAQAIYGNHELSYLQPRHRCSGYDEGREQVVMQFKEDIEKLFVPYIHIYQDFLVTHAGLTKFLWDKHDLSIATLADTLEKWWPWQLSPAHQIGQYRGGFSAVGGIFWCDFNKEFQPIEGLTQVFGHTRGKGIRQIETSFCIDCLDNEHSFLEMDL